MIPLAAIGLVCATLVAALVLVLRHLAAMRITTGELAITTGRIEALQAEVRALDSKLNIINNRQR